ncbi:MAG: PBP1A family penicillin-binding protein [Eubacteriales bacterium]|nr:PBP1A family penicillin-binding protein [Eubacteriales bacterium]
MLRDDQNNPMGGSDTSKKKRPGEASGAPRRPSSNTPPRTRRRAPAPQSEEGFLPRRRPAAPSDPTPVRRRVQPPIPEREEPPAPPAQPVSEEAWGQEPAAPANRHVITFGKNGSMEPTAEAERDMTTSELPDLQALALPGEEKPPEAPRSPAPRKKVTLEPPAQSGPPPLPKNARANRPFWEHTAGKKDFMGWLKSGKYGTKPPPDDGAPFAPRKRERNAFVGLGLTTLRLLVVALLIAGMTAAGVGIGIAKAYMDTTPDLDLAQLSEQDLSSFVYDGNGDLITTIAGMENRIYAPISEIPDSLQKAIIAIEDNRFLSHKGIDLKRIAGAFFNNLRSSSVSGGSTLTQQLIKLKVLSSERTYKRKIQEAWLALQLETQYSKDQILEAYLNAIPLGQSNYGVKAAAKDYFGKKLSELSLRECAMLAGLTQSPNTYDPRANTYSRNRMDLTDRRTDTVLMRMYECGFITKDEYRAALEADVTIVEKSNYKDMYDMPYFVEYAIQDVIDGFLKARGLPDTAANRQTIQNELRTGGYRIYLTVDRTVQQIVEDTLYNWDKYPSMRYSQDKYTVVGTSDSSFTRIEQPQAAAVVYDYHTGQIKAVVGGRSQPTTRMTLNRAYQSHMPVGSSIKPLAVYGPAIDLGLSPASPSLNVPLAIEGWNTEQGFPSNYGGGGFTGIVSLRQAMKKSLNVVAARVLMDNVSVTSSVEYLRSMGITSALNEDGAGLALGTSGITPVEMAVAYGAIANDGKYQEAFSYTKVTDSYGATILDADSLRETKQVLKESTAFILTDMLVDAVQGGTGTRAQISGMTVGGKTGTNSDNVGVSFAGITPYYSAFVWIGHDNYKPLASNATGSTGAAPLWQAFMSKIHSTLNLPNDSIQQTTAEGLGITKVEVCAVSGKLATDACRLDANGYLPVTDYFAAGTAPTDPCDQHHVLKICSTSGLIATPYCPEAGLTDKAILAIPGDSVIRQLSAADLQEYFAGAVFDYPTGDALQDFTYDNPAYASSFCNVHTAAWGAEQSQLIAARASAQTLIDSLTTRLEQATDLDASVASDLKARINALKKLANAADTTADALTQATNALRTHAASVLP